MLCQDILEYCMTGSGSGIEREPELHDGSLGRPHAVIRRHQWRILSDTGAKFGTLDFIQKIHIQNNTTITD
jgi:hypothetical protein